MLATVHTLHTARTIRAEAARRRSMLLHPSNFSPAGSAASHTGERAEELAARFECLRRELVQQGVPENEARTEVARMASREVWDGFASQLRAYRAAGQQMDANILAVALGAIQCMALPLSRHPGDLGYAGHIVTKARRRLQFNGGLMDRLHAHANPAFGDADVTLQCLEVFLTASDEDAA